MLRKLLIAVLQIVLFSAIAIFVLIVVGTKLFAQPSTIDDCAKIEDTAERQRCENVFGGKRAPPKAKAKVPDDPLLVVRKQYPKAIERRFLDQGLDFYFSVEGAAATTLRIKYILMSRPLVHKVGNEGDFLETCRKMGFRRVVFTDGHTNEWSYDLTK